MHPACLSPEQLLAECEMQTGRRSGPGGQHRNKVETAVVIKHLPTGTVAEATERRSQAANRSVALFRLRLKLAIEHREPPQPPSEIWHRRLAKGRISIAQEHDDLPVVLAEALDHLASENWNVPRVAEQLSASSSQLVKLLRTHPPALYVVNQHRERLGFKPLK